MNVTVAICTWNRASLLDRTLQAFHDLYIPEGVSWELLVVNNNCTDTTDEVLAKHAGALPLRRLWEPAPGLSNARNCAVAAANGELILWTDDDVLVDRDWLAEYVRAARENPDFAFFGGTIDPWYESEPPEWIRRNINQFFGPYAIRQLGSCTQPLGLNEDPVGANMAVRGHVAKGYKYDPRLGRTKNDLMSCEELEVSGRMRRDGHHALWVGGAKVKHFVVRDRLNAKYLRRWFYQYGKSCVREAGVAHGCRTLAGIPLYAVKGLLVAYAKRTAYLLFKNQQWAKGFRNVPYYRGIIVESRRQHESLKTMPAESSISCAVRVG